MKSSSSPSRLLLAVLLACCASTVVVLAASSGSRSSHASSSISPLSSSLASSSPASWRANADSLAVDEVLLERVDRERLRIEDAERQALLLVQEGGTDAANPGPANLKPPYRWGVAPEVSKFPGVSMRYNGNWTQISSSEWVWRLKITSPEAISQQVIFSTLWLPAGGKLWLYGSAADRARRCDAETDCYLFTASDTRIDEKFSSPIVRGAALFCEFYFRLPPVPTDTIVPRIHIAKVVQGYREVVHEKAVTAASDPGTRKGIYGFSDVCNNDATCPLVGDEWGEARRSVVQILTDGGTGGNQFSAVCTGTLLNTPSKRNFVITAFHCLEGENVDNWAFVFNYERDCVSGGSGSHGQQTRSKFKDFLSGARLIWTDKATDVILLEIIPDVPSRFGAYFAGWDARRFDLMDPLSVAFHHPSGDFKKVSVDSNAKGESSCPFCGSLDNSHIVVTGWDDGTTERGSSGCSLFDSNQRVTGILSGGSASCPDNTGFDLFGKLELAYQRGLGDYLGAPDKVMEGRWNVDPENALMTNPQTLVMVENNGDGASLDIWLREEPASQSERVWVTLALSEENRKWIASIHPTEIVFDASDWHGERRVRVTPRDNSAFDGDVKTYVKISVNHEGGHYTKSYEVDYPVVVQDDERISGDGLFDPVNIPSLPYTFMGDTAGGYTNTLQSRCELGSSSPDVIFEFTPKKDVLVTLSLCSLSLFDSALYVLENGKEKWCNDDGEEGSGCGESSELRNVPFKEGQTYHIVVDGYNGAMGRFQLRVRESGDQWVTSFGGQERDPKVSAFDGAGAPRDTFVPRDTYVPQDTYRSEAGDGIPGDTFAYEGKAKGQDQNATLTPLSEISEIQSTKAPEEEYEGTALEASLSVLEEERDHRPQTQVVDRLFQVMDSRRSERQVSPSPSSSPLASPQLSSASPSLVRSLASLSALIAFLFLLL